MNTKLPQESYAQSIDDLFLQLESGHRGLTSTEAQRRLSEFGANKLPTKKRVTLLQIFFRQFLNPLIYILGFAAALSIGFGDYSDAAFIVIVLLLNAVIGTIQEEGAEKSALALSKLTASLCFVERDGETFEIPSEELVPGDVVLLESGNKIPADLRLFRSHSVEIDESLLTGESVPVAKDHDTTFSEETGLADRTNMAFAGSLMTKGRASGLVTATGLHTELGKIAESLAIGADAKPPLLVRMEKFTGKIAIFSVFITVLMAALLLLKGQTWHEVLIFSVALAVAAIPEGLPVALTIALAIASRRMAKRNVIVRKLPAVEALGSCSFIATDKTGTLTVNQLTVRKILLPGRPPFEIEGSGLDPFGKVSALDMHSSHIAEALSPLTRSAVLCNEAQLVQKNSEWMGHGDAVDLAFLVMAHKTGLPPEDIRARYELIDELPFEPENQYASTLHRKGEVDHISVKGAMEKIIPICNQMMTAQGVVEIDRDELVVQADQLAKSGYRVLAVASKELAASNDNHADDLHHLIFLGFVGMIDPLRPEAANAIASCQRAGIDVAMVTGDHPKTALAIAKDLSFAEEMNQVVTGPQLKSDLSENEKASLIDKARVFARVEPQQKLEIVRHLLNRKKFVAVTGDGANDAPALKAANVGVAMGKSGTDIAKETADLIITDDRFASIVAGIEEGRIAYSNVRKVVYFLISTGAAEIVLFTLSILFNTPLPLTAVQVLWLNLVTSGIQDVGLAFEPGEGDELSQKPRDPEEPIFNRLMLERIGLSALVMGGFSFFYFKQLVDSGVAVDSARNLMLLLLVLFENFMVGNCRSETKSAFLSNPFSNKILLFGTIGAQLIHIGSMYVPGLRETLGVEPVAFAEWIKMLVIASSILVVIELYKLVRGANSPT